LCAASACLSLLCWLPVMWCCMYTRCGGCPPPGVWCGVCAQWSCVWCPCTEAMWCTAHGRGCTLDCRGLHRQGSRQ
jgi:hypothetical protein